jgi:lipid-binding SYLF domain-containing protein
MKTLRVSTTLVALVPFLWVASPARLAGQAVPTQPLEVWTPEAATVDASGQVIREVMAIPMRSIPGTLLAEARAIAIVPDLVKGAFLVGVRHGRGLLIVRDEAGDWRGPVFISLTGGSFGWQVGIQATDIVLVFVSRQSVQGLLRGRFTIGADAAATAGPIGREASLATDHTLKSEIYSYSLSRGLFAGLALDGSVLQVDAQATNRYYAGATATAATAGQPGQAQQLPPSALRLLGEITRWSPARLPDAPANAGAAGGTIENQRQTVSRQLAGSAQRLGSILDENWKKYLALPGDLNAAEHRPNAESLRQTLSRFQTVATSPSYRALTQRPEFQETYGLLQRLTALETASARLPLPPPPK